MSHSFINQVILFTFCLVVGFGFGAVSGVNWDSSIDEADLADTATSEDNMPLSAESDSQHWLIILVDNIASPDPELYSIWLSILNPALQQVSLFPIFPGQSLNKYIESSVFSSFKLTRTQKLDARFIERMNELNLSWDHYIVIDEAGIRILMDINPKSIENRRVDALQPGQDRKFEEVFKLSNSRQSLIVEARKLCLGISNSLGTVQPKLLQKGLANSLSTDMTAEELISIMDWRKDNQSLFVCSFPSLTAETVFH